jgi:spermidine synthase
MGHSIDIREEAGIRYLHFGTDWVQGAMRLSKPDRLVLAYTQAMLSFLLFRAEPRTVLMIGLGSASLVRFFRHALPQTHLTVIEINRDVVQVAHQFFRLPQDDDRLDVQVGNGIHFVRQSPLRFDAILVDGFDHHARAGKLESAEFYADCRARLAPQGHLRDVFGAGLVTLPSPDSKNVLVTAFADPPDLVSAAQLRERATALKERYDLPFGKWVHALQRANRPETQALFR